MCQWTSAIKKRNFRMIPPTSTNHNLIRHLAVRWSCNSCSTHHPSWFLCVINQTCWNLDANISNVNSHWLVVLTPLKSMKVNGKDDIPYIMEHNPNVWNQQPDQVPGGTSVFMPVQLRHKTTVALASVNSSSQPFRIFRMIPHVIVNQQVDVSKIWMIRLYGPSQIFTSQKADF